MQDAVRSPTPSVQESAGHSFAGASYPGTVERIRAHKKRCRTLPASTPREEELLVAQFLAKRGGVTQCPPAYLAPVR